ncbi:MAG TPA: GNAT family protein [Desulfobacterales bacterium]|jgi:RimJ/RimL family protein N-acetyltransferase|nr:GNAT family protein [Desulfobacterales bacterium]|tara:strand:- start:406 stop:957 length:552 start_codon:yes stop_codon:yes gene_type:complete
MYNPYIVGKQIYLRHPTEEDVRGKWHEWFSDEETTKYLESRFWPNSKESQLAFYNSLQMDRNKLVLSIVMLSSDEHFGVISLNNINWVHRFGDIGIVIGEKTYCNGVYAIEAYSLILKIAFLRLNLLNVKAGYCVANKSSGAILELFKFKTVGMYKKLFMVDGKKEDCVVNYLDKETWLNRNS